MHSSDRRPTIPLSSDLSRPPISQSLPPSVQPFNPSHIHPASVLARVHVTSSLVGAGNHGHGHGHGRGLSGPNSTSSSSIPKSTLSVSTLTPTSGLSSIMNPGQNPPGPESSMGNLSSDARYVSPAWTGWGQTPDDSKARL